MNSKLVSIVLPVYNGEQYLKESIDSVLEQTYQNFELIIVNDCSTDGTAEIIEEYARNDKRIKIITNKENQKLPKSLNIGFSMAQGSYFTWTSDDNYYEDNALETMVEYLDNNNEIGLVCADMELIDEEEKAFRQFICKPEEIYTDSYIGACFLYRSECVDKVGGYDENRFLVEDYEYWIRISQKYKMARIAQSLYHYRFHKNNLTGTKRAEIYHQCIKMKVDYADYLYQHLDSTKRLMFLSEIYMHDHDWGRQVTKELVGSIPKELEVVFSDRSFDESKKVVLFGTGEYGEKALDFFGEEKVVAWIDNNEQKVGQYFGGKKIYSADKLKELYPDYNIVISVHGGKSFTIMQQLEKMGIYNFTSIDEVL